MKKLLIGNDAQIFLMIVKQAIFDRLFGNSTVKDRSLNDDLALIKFERLLITISLIFVSTAYSQNQQTPRKPFTINCHNCEIISQPPPKYPAIAKTVNVLGKVNVQVLIDENGNVIEAKALDGHPFLQAESVKAAYQAKFKPKTLSNRPVRMRAWLVYNFTSNNEKTEQIKAISLGVLNDKAKVFPLPILPGGGIRVAGSVNVEVKIDLQKGKVVSASAISGHPLLKVFAEKAARQAKFEPVLTEFSTIYGTGILIYKVEDFTGKTIENENPTTIFPPVSVGILNGKARILVKPVFPKSAEELCVNEKVEVAVLIYDATGEVVAAKAISGNELLRQAAEEAVMKSKFYPTLTNGSNDFYVSGKIVYNFIPKNNCINSENVKLEQLKRNETRPQNKPISTIIGKPIKLFKPPFPPNCRCKFSKNYKVAVQFTVDEKGNVELAKAISGHPLLKQASEVAIRASKFYPSSVALEAVKASGIIVYDFVLVKNWLRSRILRYELKIK